MKKILTAFLCAALLALTAVGCGVEDPLDAQSKTEATQEATGSLSISKKVDSSNYEDSFDGLCKYFNDLEYINIEKDTVTEMDYKLIGATQGKKFKHGNVSIELYAYGDKLDDTAKEVLNSVKSNGSFTILDLPSVNAYLSDNEKYLMVYTDPSIDAEKPDENSSAYKSRAEVIESLENFR